MNRRQYLTGIAAAGLIPATSCLDREPPAPNPGGRGRLGDARLGSRAAPGGGSA